MRAIMRFSQRVLCFDAGRVIAEGTPAQVIDDPNVQRVYLGWLGPETLVPKPQHRGAESTEDTEEMQNGTSTSGLAIG